MEEKQEKHPIGAKKALLILLAFFLAAAGITGLILLKYNTFTITIHLQGPREQTIEYGEDFREPGYYVTRKGSILWTEETKLDIPVQVTGKVNTQKLGAYALSYEASWKQYSASAERKIQIVDTVPPVIEVDEDAPIPIFVPGEPYVDTSYTASDNYDGDLTDRVMILERQGELQYSVKDSSGNEAVVTREVPEYDPLPPQIHLEGEKEMHLLLGRPFEEPGYTAEDDFVGELTDRVTIEGEVDCFQPGTYPIQYTVSDDYGNQTVVTRNVVVEAVQRPEQVLPQAPTVYLTFDDGPGPYTDYLLDVLAKYGVKATFFVVGGGYPQQMQRIVREGHSIAVHSVTHNYKQIYASPEAYFQDILGEQATIRDYTGTETTLMRFPGGSSNMVSRFNPGIMTTLSEAVQDAGFQYFDWNVDSMDAGGARTKEQVRDNVIAGLQQHRVSVVLQHDIHPFSVLAVEDIIRWGQNNGYQFLPLDPTSYGAHHGVNN